MEGTRSGILGGTFNPIHNGHLHLAHHVRRVFGLSQVHFVVATTPPHKSLQSLVSLNHRYAMVCLATSGCPWFIPSLVELAPPASPFSVDTLAKLSLREAQNTLYFVAGTDSLLEVASWHDSGKLLTSCNFIFVSRPGVRRVNPKSVLPDEAAGRVRDLTGLASHKVQETVLGKKSRGNRIFMIDVEAPDISASRIRELASAGKRIRHLVPGPVHDYIRKLHLYGE